MKRLLSFLFLFVLTTNYAQLTNIPDSYFEAYLEANGMGNGITNDHLVTTANINGVITLDVSNLNISDLTGIEDFSNLTNLHCEQNELENLNISANTGLTTLYCYANNLSAIDVSNNVALKFFYCNSNNIGSLDLSTNTALLTLECSFNNLISLDLSTNVSIDYLDCGANDITSLDLTNNYYLTHMYCYNNLLTTIDLRNFNNQYLTYFSSQSNPNLTCIYVDQVAWCQENWTDIDLHTNIVADETACTVGVQSFINTSYFSLSPNPTKDSFKIKSQEIITDITIFNVLGKEVNKFSKQASYSVSNLSKGVYLVRVRTKKGVGTKKLLIE